MFNLLMYTCLVHFGLALSIFLSILQNEILVGIPNLTYLFHTLKFQKENFFFYYYHC